jgi:GTPase
LRSFSTSASSTGSGSTRHFPKEVDASGNVEYKFRLVNITSDRLEHLRTQMKWRVEEGRGEALYRIGVMDDGEAVGLNVSDMTESLETIARIAKPLGFEHVVVDEFDGIINNHRCVEVMIKKPHKLANDKVTQEVRVAIIGAFDSGKSSITAFLTRGITDDGRGKAGRCVAVHKHEIRHGRTSSFSSHALPPPSPLITSSHYQKDMVLKGVENIFSDFQLDHDYEQPGVRKGIPPKILTLMDTAGHPKSLSSCLRGISGLSPDYFMLCVDIQAITGRAPEKLVIAQDFLRICRGISSSAFVFLVITKMDDTSTTINPVLLESFATRELSLQTMTMENCETIDLTTSIPIFHVSSVSGYGMDCLAKFLHFLSPRRAEISTVSQEIIANSEIADDEDRLSVLGIAREYVLTDDLSNDATTSNSSLGGGIGSMLAMNDYAGDGSGGNLSTLLGDEESISASPSPSPLTTSKGAVAEGKLIVVGVVQHGTFRLNQTLFVGPDRDNGVFSRAVITSMRCAADVPVSLAEQGTTVAMCLKFLDCDDGRNFARRGALVCNRPCDLETRLLRTFEVELAVGAENGNGDLKKNEEVIVFVGVVSQAARVIEIFNLAPDVCRVTLQFVYRMDYILKDTILIKKGSNQVLVAKLLNHSLSI